MCPVYINIIEAVSKFSLILEHIKAYFHHATWSGVIVFVYASVFRAKLF